MNLSQQSFNRASSMSIPCPPADSEREQLKQLAQKYLDDPVLQGELCDRVYKILRADLRIQRERIGHFRKGR